MMGRKVGHRIGMLGLLVMMGGMVVTPSPLRAEKETASGHVASGTTLEEFQRRERTVSALLESYHRLQGSQGGASGANEQEILGLLEKAKSLVSAGQLNEGHAVLEDTYTRVRTAITKLQVANESKTAGNKDRGDIGKEKTAREYNHLHDSFRALQEARQRISHEKGLDPNAWTENSRVEAWEKEAASLAGQDRFAEAKNVLTQAYDLTRHAVHSLKSGTEEKYAPLRLPEENTENNRQKYAKRVRSMESLLATYGEIAQAKGRQEEAQTLIARVRAVMEKADASTSADHVNQGMMILDSAYLEIRKSLIELRKGDSPILEKMVWGDENSPKAQADFKKKMVSLRSLAEAHQRILAEKNRSSEGEAIQDQVQKEMATASSFVEQGQTAQGRMLLDQAYVRMRDAVEHLRQGETLVRSLNFASKEEEYLYEVDRNDSYLMLTQLLVANKSPEEVKRVEALIPESTRLRQQAESQAAAGEFAQSVTSMEQATEVLIRALRMAGIPIPG
ncbi:MAG: hypothetical protein HW380_1921 [Magnetococcales bacterium]|nr:hypothetical protein [Magnetococcales bacterium]HIJ83416.1 hypothetical protein [Magnetococcales bacterium]